MVEKNMNTLFTVEQDAFWGSSPVEREFGQQCRNMLWVAQNLSNEMQKTVYSLLDLLDEKICNNNPWILVQLFEEKKNPSTTLHLYSFFCKVASYDKRLMYANRFPSFCYRISMNTIPEESKECTPDELSRLFSISTKEDLPTHENVRVVLLNNIRYLRTSEEVEVEERVPIYFEDNLYEVLAYLMFVGKETECIKIEELLEKIGYSKKVYRQISKKIIKLLNYISSHIKSKVDNDTRDSVNKIDDEIRYYRFWNSEFLKRQLYVKYINDDEDTKFYVESIFLQLKSLNDKESLTSNESIITGCVYSSIYDSNCGFQVSKNFINDKIINNLILFVNGKETPASILFPYRPKYIYEFYIEHCVFPRVNYLYDLNIGSNKEDPRTHKSYLKEVVSSIKDEFVSDSHRIDDKSFIIGIYIWDEVHIFKNKNSISEISKKACISLSLVNFVNDIKNISKEELDYFNNCYIKVRECILSKNCELISMKEALKRNSQRKTADVKPQI